MKQENIYRDRPCTFLGANSSHGFVSKFNKCYNVKNSDRAYIIKGGPGTGKSSTMKYIAQELENKGIECEYSFCSSDPDSLDGLIIPQKKTVILDGTPPHALEPAYPGICEKIVPFTECFNTDLLFKNREELLKLYRSNAMLHSKVSRFLAAVGELSDDSFSLDCKWTDYNKITELADKLCKDLLKERPDKPDSAPNESVRFLSGITSKGFVFFENTVSYYADTVYVIEDCYGAASSLFMSSIRNNAIEKGFDIISCLCPISPHRKIDHIIIPQLRLAFCTSNDYLKINSTNTRKIHARRFRDTEKLKQKRERLSFNARATKELLTDAQNFLKDAKKVHDMIEKYYIESTDFEKVNFYRDRILKEIELK